MAPNKMTLNDYQVCKTSKAQAGRLTNLGSQILEAEHGKAKHIVTYPWKAKQFDTEGMKPAKFKNVALQKRRDQSCSLKLTD